MSTKARNHYFFSQVVAEVGKLSTTAIISKYTKTHVNRFSDNDALCPFHGDETFGNFKINDKKGIFKCFACGAYGDGVQFVKDLFNLSYKPAVLRIAVDQGIITETQAEEYLGGKIGDVQVQMASLDSLRGPEKRNGIIKPVSEYQRHVAYTIFMKHVTLSDKHRAYLRSRGLTDEEIEKKGFFTFPTPTEEFVKQLADTCRKYGVSTNLYKGVPGFHTTPDMATGGTHRGEPEFIFTFAKRNGIGIPHKNGQGMITGIQIRKDTVNDKKKRYTWFSSSYAGYDDNNYIFGSVAGAPTHVAYPAERKFKDVVFITEGFFKAEELAKHFGAISISVSGVGNYRTINDDLKKIPFLKLHHLFVAYDADMCKNIQVYQHAKNMVNLIREEYPDVKVYMAIWREEDGKGIDDLIQNGKAHTLRRVDFDRFAALYDAMLEEFGQENFNQIPKEVVATHYNQEVFSKIIAS